MNLLRLANIPAAFQGICRSTTHVPPSVEDVARFTLGQIEGLPASLRSPQGATLLGPPLSGKTYWGCAWLKAILAEGLFTVRENFCDPRRFDYLDLLSQKEDFSSHYATMQNFREARVVFLDNITLRPPTPALFSGLLTRRDEGRITWLAFQAETMNQIPEGLIPVFQSFRRANQAFLLKPFIPPTSSP